MIEYTSILHRNMFTSQISKPTRITNTSSTIIDYILINNCNVSVMSGILEFQITDHLPVMSCTFIKSITHCCLATALLTLCSLGNHNVYNVLTVLIAVFLQRRALHYEHLFSTQSCSQVYNYTWHEASKS